MEFRQSVNPHSYQNPFYIMEYRHTSTAPECTRTMEEEIQKVCQQLIYQNRKLGSIDASQFPTISYNSIQKIYRYLDIRGDLNYRTTYHSMESKQEDIIKKNMQNLITEFECGLNLNRMAEKYCYMYPVLVRLFLQAYYKLDPAVVMSYIHHPVSIPHPRLRSSVRSIFQNWLIRRQRSIFSEGMTIFCVTMLFGCHPDMNTSIW